MHISRLIDILLHFIFPVSCPVCGKPGSKLCPECRDKDTVTIPTQQIPSLFTGGILTHDNNGLTVYASLPHDAKAKSIINSLKHERELCRVIGHHMAEMFGECEADYLLPIPLHLYSKRKYNQSLELAEGMREVWQNVSIINSALWTREVWSSRNITHEDFRFTKDIYGKRVALVDDVCITGRTLACLAETCRREGAEVICAYTFAAEKTREDAAVIHHTDAGSVIDEINAKRYEELSRFFPGPVITRQINSLTIYSACDYHNSGIREEIHKMKYSGAVGLCAHFGRHMAEKFRECRADYLLPVPLHLNSDRNYNQSLELAGGMCTLWDVKILDAAEWTRIVPNHTTLTTANERRLITHSDFRITQDIKGLRIALVDDVCTTGSTLNALRDSCERAGAIIICAYTLASA